MFNKKNKFSRLLLVSVFLILALVFLFNFSSAVLASDTFGTNIVGNNIALGDRDPRSIATQVINIGMSVLGIIALAIVIYAGFMWMTSEGQEDKIEKAKKILKAGVIGLAIILASWGITAFVLSRLGNATGTTGGTTCVDGSSDYCGCNGRKICSAGSWGTCLGSSCLPGSSGSYCNGSLDPNVCSPDNTQCNTGLVCGNNCRCAWPGEGDPCGDSSSGTCSPNNNDCTNPNLTCSPSSCTCVPNNDDNGYSELGEACNDGGSCSATENVCNPNHGLSCDSVSCKCIGDPVILAVSPVGGFCANNINVFCEKDTDCPGSTCDKTTPNTAKGNFITIFGYNFDEYLEGVSNVWLAKGGENYVPEIKVRAQKPIDFNSSCQNTWTNNKIVVAIPTSTGSSLNLLTGDNFRVEVHTKNRKIDISNDDSGPKVEDIKINEISRPGLCGMSKNEGASNEDVYYYGVGLNNSQVYFGNLFSSVLAFVPNTLSSDNSGMTKVPAISAGDTSTFVKRNKVNSNILDFTKLADAPVGPFISSFTPSEGSAGQYISILGDNFGRYKGNSSVYFRLNSDDTEANFNFPAVCADYLWSNNQILIKVPSGLINGNYNLVLKIGSWPEVVSVNTFKVDSALPLAPSICKISPSFGPNKTPVSLWGEYFGNACSAIFYNNKSTASVDSVSDNGADKISVIVPSDSLTGPVVVSRAGISGNSVNFSIGTCTKRDDCSTDSPVCCLTGSPRAGACVANESACFAETPLSSIFQWKFTTGFNTFGPVDPDNPPETCANFNFCPEGYVCPNAPGVCSNYNGSNSRTLISGKCRLDCTDYCAEGECQYGRDLDRCVVKINPGSVQECDLDLNKEISYRLSPTSPVTTTTVTAVCKKYNTPNGDRSYYKIDTNISCPIGWISALPGECIEVASLGVNSNCDLCGDGKTCFDADTTSSTNKGICTSNRLCSGDYRCDENNQCSKVVADTASCQCCCEKDKNTADGNPGCCAPLTCDNTCGASAGSDPSSTNFGLCSGCKISDTTTTSVRDLACNCVGTSGKYCDVDGYASGACLDCSALSETACKEHSATCCYDAKNDKCRGGASGASVWGSNNSNIGMCPYYNCDTADPTMCASNTPTTTGTYKDVDSCDSDSGCKANCSAITSASACKEKGSCCWNENTSSCSGGEKYSNVSTNEKYGICAFYKCNTLSKTCFKTTDTSTYNNFNECNINCRKTPAGPGTPCYDAEAELCTDSFCSQFVCLNESGQTLDSGNSESCGTCCCNPNDADNNICKKVGENLNCQADKGTCSGASRGLCCGCSSDDDCTVGELEPEEIGCGFDTCCQARPTIKTNSANIGGLDVLPKPLSNNACRNGVIEINFDKRMDALSLDSNILLLQEKESGSTCPNGTQKIAGLDNFESNSSYEQGFFATLKKIFNKSLSQIAKIFGKESIAADGDLVYCSVMGSIEIDHSDLDESSVYFKPNQLLEPSAKYFVVVKGDENLDSQSGVKSFVGVGMNGKGFYTGNNTTYNPALWVEAFDFSGKLYPNSYIWSFSTLSPNTPGQGICTIEYLEVRPESYLFQDNKNDLKENDADAKHSSFDSVRDRDKAYYVKAKTVDDQIIGPSNGYSWLYDWSINNTNVIEFNNDVVNWTATSSNRLVQVKSNVLEGKSDVIATVKMDPTNIINTGNGVSRSVEAYIMLCKNPWPAFKSDGTWAPWFDSSLFNSYNYQFYYCRDSGRDDDTTDDLPAFMTNSVINKGVSLFKICSNNPNISCDTNSDCPGNALCIVSFLKETYLFRTARNRFISSFEALDNGSGNSVNLSWTSGTEGISRFLVYFGLAGSPATPSSVSVPTSNCQLVNSGTQYSCSYTLSGLSADQSYNIRIAALNSNSAEIGSSLYTSIMPIFVPFVDPFTAVDTTAGKELNLSWQSNIDNINSFKLYYKKGDDSSDTQVIIPLNGNCERVANKYYCNYKLKNLVDRQEYTLRIIALKGGEEEIGSSRFVSATPTFVYIPIIKNLNVVDTSVGGILRVIWNVETDRAFDTFNVCFSSAGCTPISKNSFYCVLSDNKYSCSYDRSGLINDKKYDVYIRVLNNSQTVETSSTVSATPTFVPFVTNFSAVDAGTGGRINLSWQSPKAGVYRYYLVRSFGNSGGYTTYYPSSCQSSGNNYVCSSAMNGLVDGQTYNVRIDVQNNINQIIGSSNTIAVTPTKPENECPAELEYNGYNYKTVQIGPYCWTAENLRTTLTNGGEEITEITENDEWINAFSDNKMAYSWYKNDSSSNMAFGLLYNKIAVDSGKLCPKGWHIPKGDEVDKTIDYLRSSNLYWCGASSSNIAKSVASVYKWKDSSDVCRPGNNSSGNNKSGFDGMPSGIRRSNGEFSDQGEYAYFWKNNGIFFFSNNSSDIKVDNITIQDSSGFSVRCIMD